MPHDVSAADDGQGVLDRLLDLRRWTLWHRHRGVLIDGDIGHPQGLARGRDGWIVSTVFPHSGRGEVVVVGDDGRVQERLDVTDGERFHPGGIDVWADSTRCWVAVAEYRPDSTTMVAHLEADPRGGLRCEPAFRFDDHLGAVCELADGTLFAVSWGSRRWYRLGPDGRVFAERTNPDHTIDLQDLQRLDDRHVVGTGVGSMLTPTGPLQLGGLVVIDVDRLSPIHSVPIPAWMPSGRVATFNATHLGLEQGDLALRCVVDDTTAELGTWVAGRATAG